ncbi:MAG: hypothetical protein M1819_000458 [Sarea resinae]|nr:MAG: hypothetical protein M1819_000458 [Sarea resinae]
MHPSFARLRAAAIDGRCENTRFRQNQLRKLHDALLEKVDALRDAIIDDSGTTPSEADAECYLTISSVKEHYESLDFEKSIHDEYNIAKGRDYLNRKVGYGIVYIVPATHTLSYSLVSPVCAAMAAGNCVCVELPNDPRAKGVVTILRKLLVAALDQESFAILENALDESERSLCLQVIQVQDRASGPPSALQLVSPSSALAVAVVDRTADVDAAAKALVAARFSFRGRSPYAPDLVLVNEFAKEAFIYAAVQHCAKILASTNGSSSGDGKEVDSRFDGEDDKKDSVRVVLQGANGTIIDIRNRGSHLLEKKTSTAVLKIHSVSSLDDAIDYTNKSYRKSSIVPLASYIFAAPGAAKYLSQYLASSITLVNNIPSQLLVGPAAPAYTTPSLQPRYSRALFEMTRPAIVDGPPQTHHYSEVLARVLNTDDAALSSRNGGSTTAGALKKEIFKPLSEKKVAPGEAVGASRASQQQTRSSPSTSAKQDRGLFQCAECKRSYTRLDHLARHVRSHTQEKPFVCQFCSKGFTRPDLLKRHTVGHDPGSDNKRQKRQHPYRNYRVSRACEACARAKMKCEENRPCGTCRRRGISCESEPGIDSTSRDDCLAMPASDEIPDWTRTSHSSSQTQMAVNEYDDTDSLETIQLQTPATLVQDEDRVLMANGNFSHPPNNPSDATTAHHFDANLLRSDQGAHDPSYNHYDIANFGSEMSLDLNDIDFGFLDALNGSTPFTIDPAQDNGEASERQGCSSAPRGLMQRIEAYKKSGLTPWNPGHQDNGFSHQKHLSLPSHMANEPGSNLHEIHGLGPVVEGLKPGSRDNILAMILSGCKPREARRIVSSFPSNSLLDSLMQYFFATQKSQVDSWIHVPTFRPNSTKPELVGAIIAAGAILTPILTIRKLGFALQEAFEEDNSLTRELQILQGYVLQLDLGLWSGCKRKMELAESFEQPLLTMLRRAGRFRRSTESSFVPLSSDEGEILEAKWHQWAKHESFKRLVFHLFIHDAQSSISLLVNPLISYAELALQLPDSRDLWDAEDATRWKGLYLSKMRNNDEKSLSAVDCIHDLSYLGAYHERIDLPLSTMIVLHSLWGLIWEYRQLNSILKSQPSVWNGLVLDSRYQELCQVVKNSRLSYSAWSEHHQRPEIDMFLELLLMHLDMSFDDIQLFAGKEDREEAWRVIPSLRQWVSSPRSLRAIWHAGQLVRAANLFPAKALRDFYSICVYQASLAFWAYCVLSRSTKEKSGDEGDGNGCRMTATDSPYIYLDGPDSPDVQRFIAQQHGTPSLSGLPCDERVTDGARLPSVPLDDSPKVIEMLCTILRRNCGDEPVPPLVGNLIDLMQDLGAAATESYS